MRTTTKTGYPEIEPRPGSPSAPLSFQQERVLYLDTLATGRALWNRLSCKRLSGPIDVRRLDDAIAALIARHAALRTRIHFVDGEPRQSRRATLEGAFECVDLSGAPGAEAEAQARAILNREYEQPLSLDGGPLFKAVLMRRGDVEAWLLLKLHHIISDATTLRILWNDLTTLYNAGPRATETLRPLEIDYFDYAGWLREALRPGNTGEQESYWLCQFAGALPELDLPSDLPAPPTLTFNGALLKQPLPDTLIQRLQSFSLERRVIPFSTLLSAYWLLLHNYCRQDDIVVGTVFSGRHYSPRLKAIAGFFSNTVALRARLDGRQTVDAFVKHVHTIVTDAHTMQDYPFERLVTRLDPDREHKRNPLFRAMFNLVTDYDERTAFAGVRGEGWLEPDVSATQVDFFLDVHLGPAGSDVRVEYNSDIFSKATIRRMLRHYVVLVERMMESPDTNARSLSMLDAAETAQVLSFGEGRSAPAVRSRTIVDLLEQRAARSPAQTALVSADGVLTCAALNTRVNQLATTLIAAGVDEGDVVAVMLDRSPEMVIGLLAIAKAGAAYLPIDPTFPRQRIAYILRDSGVACLLSQSGAADALGRDDGARPITCIPVDAGASYTGDGRNVGRSVPPSSPAYVIYTSGSTGAPKGVVIEHGALMNTLEFLEQQYALDGKTILLKTNFTFDVSTAELFGWLFRDGRLAVLDAGAEKDPARLLEAIATYGVTHVNFVPSMLDAFLSGLQPRDIPALERLEYVCAAGEALKPDLVDRFHRAIRHVRLENLYGPTEAAVYATWHSLPRGEESTRVPIGRPLPHTRAYILDEDLRLLPAGLIGELCLSGAGLARGYLNQPQLTDEKFCPNPYWDGERLYRTGDLALWSDDGLIHYIGRSDGQVKIRGFRVELGEVEQKLLACRGVREVAVTARTDQFGQKRLVAYLSMQNGHSGAIDALGAEMAAWLPPYMIPDRFVELPRLPRLASGKVDRQLLPEPERRAAPAAAPKVAPTELERTIIGIAEGLLNTTGLDPASNFFRLGGNSLLTLRFIAALDEALGTRLSVLDFLGLPTIAQIARLIEPAMPPMTPAAAVIGSLHGGSAAGAPVNRGL